MMAKLKDLSKADLFNGFLSEVRNERSTIGNIIEYIVEIDRQRHYLEHDCTSLSEFLRRYGRYSGSCAQRRKDAARIARDVPELTDWLRSGEINLTQTYQLAKFVREAEKESPVLPKMKRVLLNAVRGKSTDDTELTLAQMLKIVPVDTERARIQADESMRREVTFTKEDEAVLKRVLELVSHILPNPTFGDLVMHIANDFVKRNDPHEQNPVDAKKLKVRAGRRVPPSTRRYIFQTQKCCQWKYADGTICGSRFRLEIDHIKPLHKGGTSDAVNLQLLCDQHNRQKYRDGS